MLRAVLALFSLAMFGQAQAQISLSLTGIALRIAGGSYSSDCFKWFTGTSGPCPTCFVGFQATNPLWTLSYIKWGCMAQCLATVGRSAPNYAWRCPALGAQATCVQNVVNKATSLGIFNTSPALQDPANNKNIALVNSVTSKLCQVAAPYGGCGGLIQC